MKMGNEHLVPLPIQTIEVLELLRDMTGHYELVFPSERDRNREMSDNTMRRAIFKMGYSFLREILRSSYASVPFSESHSSSIS